MMLFTDQVAIVTGAGRGIGYGISQKLAQEGATVVLAELVGERGEQAAQQLRDQGFQAEAFQIDVTQPESCADLAKEVLQRYGRIDLLVNNAGLFIEHKAEETPEADWRLQLDVLLTGPFLCAQAVANAAMIPQRRGSIINISSVGGMGGWQLRLAYNTAKAGLISLTQNLAVEWAPYHIRVNAVSPGPTMTEMLADAIRSGLSSLENYTYRVPLGRVGEVKEIVDGVIFLASERASYITGFNLIIDGGWIPYGNPRGRGYPEN